MGFTNIDHGTLASRLNKWVMARGTHQIERMPFLHAVVRVMAQKAKKDARRASKQSLEEK